MAAKIVFKIDELRNYAARAGLGLQFVVKEAFLFELAELLGDNKFVMKGGAAINKVYLPGHQRFSENLDYDTDESKERVREIINDLGWDVKREYFMGRSIGFLLGYEFEGIKDSAKVDFSFSIKGEHEKKQMASDFLPISKRIEVYSLHDLIMQKERTFESRLEWKDLYDLYWLSRLYPKEFVVNDKEKFKNALGRISIPKSANSFIPTQKRTNWRELIEALDMLST